CAYYNWYFDVW
nr:immunoglobulin heavy chain junction region [Mus musculus]MBK4190143.1 immunoglobulin heavy chain junction region [Mus musculus]